MQMMQKPAKCALFLIKEHMEEKAFCLRNGKNYKAQLCWCGIILPSLRGTLRVFKNLVLVARDRKQKALVSMALALTLSTISRTALHS